MPVHRPAAHAASLGRHHGHVDGRLADHRPHAGRRASISMPAGATAASRRRRPPAGASPTSSPATSRIQLRRAYRLDRFATGHLIDEKGAGRPAQPALRPTRMRIPCPYLRRARRSRVHLSRRRRARAARPGGPMRREPVHRLRLPARQPGRAASASYWYHAPAAAPGSWSTRDTRTHEIAAARRAGRGRRPTSGRDLAAPTAVAGGGSIDRGQPLAFTLRRPRAMTGYAGRHAGLGAARQRRAAGRPLVQVSPAARHPHRRVGGAERAGRAAHRRAARAEHAGDHGRALRRARGSEPEPLAVARASTCCAVNQPARAAASAPASTTRPSCGRPRFWEKLYEPLIRRAAGLGRAAGEPIRTTTRRRYAFCDVLVIGAGPAGPCGRARRGARRRAGDPLRRGFPPRRPAARRAARGRRQRRRRLGGGGRGGARGACRMSGSCARTTVFGVYDGGTYGALERVADHLPCRRSTQPRQRLGRSSRKRAVLAAGAIERPSSSAATTGPA